MSKKNPRNYDKGFKKNAVTLCKTSEKSFKEIAENLGMPTSTLASWVKADRRDGEEAFPGKGHIKSSDAEVVQLRKELAIAREERDILKKALGIFSLQRK
jgi:transposase